MDTVKISLGKDVFGEATAELWQAGLTLQAIHRDGHTESLNLTPEQTEALRTFLQEQTLPASLERQPKATAAAKVRRQKERAPDLVAAADKVVADFQRTLRGER